MKDWEKRGRNERDEGQRERKRNGKIREKGGGMKGKRKDRERSEGL